MYGEAERIAPGAAELHCPAGNSGAAPLRQINAPLTKHEWKASYAAARAGHLPEQLWCELYFQSARDASVAPAGLHTMSVFAQYVPFTFVSGQLGWTSRRSKEPSIPAWTHQYNWHRPHASLNQLPPITRAALDDNNLLSYHI
ncbi:hypothetical protein [Edaphobacter modestus]|uniref:hypothetical protein n=1 Tax=Edaphobacter modestus TaxID=388466 RepID=UPI00102AAF8D